MSEICPVRPPNEELADSLVWEYQANPGSGPAGTSGMECSEQPYTLEHPKMMAMRKNSNGNTHVGSSGEGGGGFLSQKSVSVERTCKVQIRLVTVTM